MQNYLFIGASARFYPNILTDHGSLIAEPGDVFAFDEPPTDGNWIETDQPETIPEPRIWPPKPANEPAALQAAETAPAATFNPPLHFEELS